MKFETNKLSLNEFLGKKPIVPSVRSIHDRPKHTIENKGANRFGKTKFQIPQIFVLIAMLLMVIYAMHESGKPENWEWMGFKDPTAQPEPEQNQQSAENFASTLNPNRDLGNSEAATTTISQPNDSLDANSQPDGSIDIANDTAANLNTISAALRANMPNQGGADPSSKIAGEFWRSIIGKMKPDQQSMLLKMLRSMRRGETQEPETREACGSLVSIISKNRERFHQKLFDQLALTTEGTEEKKKLSSDLFQSQALWDDKVLPALNAAVQGEDFTLEQLQSTHQLQARIDPVLFDQVQDNTAIGWAGDSGTWNRIWEIVLGPSANVLVPQEPAPNFKPATRIELMSQPEFYRGQPIKVEGWVRTARFKEVSDDSKLGIKKQYIMWVRPEETKQGPYCVYAHELPANFPELSNRFQDVNEHVHIEGYFFKIRTYVAADSSAITCPVIVASRLTRIAPVEIASSNSWVPSRATWIAALLLMPILATAIAWWAYRASQSNSYQPGKKTANKIDKALGALTNDPNVQTDREKIQALYDSDFYESDPDYKDEFLDDSDHR